MKRNLIQTFENAYIIYILYFISDLNDKQLKKIYDYAEHLYLKDDEEKIKL